MNKRTGRDKRPKEREQKKPRQRVRIVIAKPPKPYHFGEFAGSSVDFVLP